LLTSVAAPSPAGYDKTLFLLIDDETTRDALEGFADEGSHSQSTLRLLEFSNYPTIARGKSPPRGGGRPGGGQK